ncbi:apoptosis-inducing factor 3-like [Planoprotostelium fungivorum]|uniref:Apoptosis-inducing factor 3-like n=1 Tax=Planoprotostelium fungivorum TaxID=1890364 RepID=A0A2P6NND4_9EUKA|nr:apoptosis-inducing factor 3-like [Planoprotostelium fungivorum]
MSIVEAAVCKYDDLPQKTLKEFELGEGKVLLVRDGDQVFATGHKCTHYAAPLKSGAYSNGTVRCPWHGACFNMKTGDIEDFPGIDPIHTFETEIKDGQVIVRASAEALTTGWKKIRPPCDLSKKDSRIFLLIGGGPASTACADTLRDEGFTGRIIIACKENFLPYDRPKLSKAMNISADKIYLRNQTYFDQHGIEVLLGTEVTELDAKNKKAKLSNGETIQYDAALVACGGSPRPIPAPGFDLKNIFSLRDPNDANNIHTLSEGKRVVIVGSSFIGMEVASCIVKKAASVIVVGMESVPFERVLGADIGLALQKLHEKNNVVFRMKRVVKEFVGNSGKISSVILDSGEILEADLVVVGAGIIPATDFIKGASIEVRDKSVLVDKTMKSVDNEGLYAAGDIARFPYFLTGESVRIEHWAVAQNEGKIAALGMLGKSHSFENVPYFWTTQYGKSLRYCGHVLSYDKVIYDGKVEDLSFVGYYVKDDKVVGAVSLGKDPHVSAVAQLIESKRLPTGEEIEKLGPIELLKRVQLK